MGSTLRGAFGYALKRVTCINPSFRCDNCFAKDNCLYYDFYEHNNSFHKYRFEIKLESKQFDFGLYLFEGACDNLAYILSALEKMLREIGLGVNRYKFNDFKIYLNGEEIYNGVEFKSLRISPKSLNTLEFRPNLKLKILTPIRIKRDNRLLRNSLELEDILTSIYKRGEKLRFNRDVFKLDYTPTYQTLLKALIYKPLLRRSNRQNQKMQMDGILGEIVIMGIDKRSYQLLKLGELVGVGKQTVFGLGRVEVEKI
jgi:CRISPR/Cas system endoribonuclease Cas6 (RAMP superfamily)